MKIARLGWVSLQKKPGQSAFGADLSPDKNKINLNPYDVNKSV